MSVLDELRKKKDYDKTIYSFYSDNGKLAESYSFAGFSMKTSMIAYELSNILKPNEVVILCYPPGLDFICALVGCFKAKLIPVPVYPPSFEKLDKDMISFCSIIAGCGAKYVLTNSTYYTGIKLQYLKSILSFTNSVRFPDIEYILTNNIANTFTDFELDVKLSDVAYIQYTSGSTNFPKGVMISHANLNHNISLLKNVNENDRVLFWLPQYHDFGLVFGFLCAIYKGNTYYNMSPLTFIKYPETYCKLIDNLKITISGMPNFGYKYLCRKINEPKYNFDSLKFMANAAEPIIRSDLENFINKFNIRKNVIAPGYGLAEHTITISYTLVESESYDFDNKGSISVG
jgi:acyl-CoA synthetase (AMP-forming)/AMP-acid ligase II